MEASRCDECGMLVFPAEYHPYTACVLYKQTKQAEKVYDLLRNVLIYGYNCAKKGVDVDTAMRNIAASNNACTRTAGVAPSNEQDTSPCANCERPERFGGDDACYNCEEFSAWVLAQRDTAKSADTN